MQNQQHAMHCKQFRWREREAEERNHVKKQDAFRSTQLVLLITRTNILQEKGDAAKLKYSKMSLDIAMIFLKVIHHWGNTVTARDLHTIKSKRDRKQCQVGRLFHEIRNGGN